MFRDFVNRYATPLTTGLFAVSAVSGVALFLHVGTGYFREMHEWLSMVLLVPFALHVWKNWGPIVTYLRRGWLVAPLAVSLAAAVVLALPGLMGGEGGGNPQMAMFRSFSQARIVDLAPVLRTTPDRLIETLKASGIAVASAEATLAEAAAAAGKDERHAVFAVLGGR